MSNALRPTSTTDKSGLCMWGTRILKFCIIFSSAGCLLVRKRCSGLVVKHENCTNFNWPFAWSGGECEEHTSFVSYNEIVLNVNVSRLNKVIPRGMERHKSNRQFLSSSPLPALRTSDAPNNWRNKCAPLAILCGRVTFIMLLLSSS